jgi:hypothetical protein
MNEGVMPIRMDGHERPAGRNHSSGPPILKAANGELVHGAQLSSALDERQAHILGIRAPTRRDQEPGIEIHVGLDRLVRERTPLQRVCFSHVAERY